MALSSLVCAEVRVTACLEMSGNLLNVRKKIMSGKSCLKLFIITCIFASIQVFSRNLFYVKH